MTEPPWLVRARSYVGVREVPGAPSSGTIMGWAKKLGMRILGAPYGSDAVPWCGLFVAHVMKESGFGPAPIALRARSWADWGARLQPDRLAPGAILVFQREGGGHVGFYVGEDSTAYHVLGGNQSDSVNVTRVAKSRLVASRWPRGVPVIGGPVHLSTDGRPLSRNEA